MSYNRYKNTQKRKNYLLIHNKEKYDRVSIILPKGTKEKIKRLDILNRTLCQGLGIWAAPTLYFYRTLHLCFR